MLQIVRYPLFAAFILLMLAGNGFALYKLFADKQEFLSKFPRLTENALRLFRFLPLLNIIALAGLWFLKPWGAYLAISCALAVIGFDIWYHVWYHLPVAAVSAVLLFFFLAKNWDKLG